MHLPIIESREQGTEIPPAHKIVDERESPVAYMIGYLAAAYGNDGQFLASLCLLLQRTCPLECLKIATTLRSIGRKIGTQDEPMLPWEQRLYSHLEATAAVHQTQTSQPTKG